MKRTALRIWMVTIAISALVGVYVVAFGEGSDLEGRLGMTSVVVALYSTLVLAHAPAWERRRLVPVPRLGMITCGLGALVGLITVWMPKADEVLVKLAFSLALISVLTAHACLLALVDVPVRFRWAWVGSLLTAGLFGVFLLLGIWETTDDEVVWRLTGALGILVLAFTALVPILSRVGAPAGASGDGLDTRLCPTCGAGLPVIKHAGLRRAP